MPPVTATPVAERDPTRTAAPVRKFVPTMRNSVPTVPTAGSTRLTVGGGPWPGPEGPPSPHATSANGREARSRLAERRDHRAMEAPRARETGRSVWEAIMVQRGSGYHLTRHHLQRRPEVAVVLQMFTGANSGPERIRPGGDTEAAVRRRSGRSIGGSEAQRISGGRAAREPPAEKAPKQDRARGRRRAPGHRRAWERAVHPSSKPPGTEGGSPADGGPRRAGAEDGWGGG
jgi:hypothetical protein